MPPVEKLSKALFDSKDTEILSHAVSMHPNLEFACYAAALAREHLKFPIESHAGLDPLFAIRSLPPKIANRKIRPAHVKKFFPAAFFPIANPLDLIGKVAAAMAWGDSVHFHERLPKEPERFIGYQVSIHSKESQP